MLCQVAVAGGHPLTAIVVAPPPASMVRAVWLLMVTAREADRAPDQHLGLEE
jgi:hypothetical protein